METCSSAMSTRVKQHAVIEFLTAEKVTPTEIHRHLKAVYGDDAVDRSNVNPAALYIITSCFHFLPSLCNFVDI
jgi:hypothetical protein